MTHLEHLACRVHILVGARALVRGALLAQLLKAAFHLLVLSKNDAVQLGDVVPGPSNQNEWKLLKIEKKRFK